MPFDDRDRSDDAAAPNPLANIEIEQALLALLFVKDQKLYDIADRLKPEHFSHDVHSAIFSYLVHAITNGAKPSWIAFAPRLALHPSFAKAGDRRAAEKYMRQLAMSVVGFDAKNYAEIIIDCWRRRAASTVAQELAARVPDLNVPSLDLITEAHTQLIDISQNAVVRGPVPIKTAVGEALVHADAVYKADGKIIGVPTGILDLDRAIGGLHPTDLVVLGARPSMGKTALLVGAMTHASREGHRGVIFEREMSRDQLAARQLAAVTGISAERQRTGPLVSEDMDRLIEGSKELNDLPLVIDDDTANTVADLRLRALKVRSQGGLSIIGVDYVQLLRDTHAENRVQEISNITRDLKALAKELQVPVLALAQLSREVEKRDDRRPQLGDLRESGSVEQDADVVIFIYREEYYLENEKPHRYGRETPDAFTARQADHEARLNKMRGVAELVVAKNRHGRTKIVTVHWNPNRTRFENLQQAGMQV